MNNERHTLTEKEFAAAVGLNLGQIGALRRQGRVPHYRVGRRVLYSPAHILEFLHQFEIPASGYPDHEEKSHASPAHPSPFRSLTAQNRSS